MIYDSGRTPNSYFYQPVASLEVSKADNGGSIKEVFSSASELKAHK